MEIIVFTIAFWGGLIGGNYIAESNVTQKSNIWNIAFLKDQFGMYAVLGVVIFVASFFGGNVFYIGCGIILILMCLIGYGAGKGKQGERYNEAALALTLGKTEKAVSLFKAALKEKEDFFEAHFELGKIYFDILEDYTEALVHFERGVAMEPNFPEINVYLANTYAETGEYLKAIDAFKKVLLLKPEESGLIYGDIGACYKEAKRYEEAVEYLLKSILHSPSAGLYRLLALSYRELNKEEEEVNSMKKAVEIEPTEANKQHLGITFFNQEKYDEAEQLFNEILAENSLSAEAIYGLGMVYGNQRRREDALSELIKLSELDENLAQKLRDEFQAIDDMGEQLREQLKKNA